MAILHTAIFDLDGTLLDSLEDLADCANEMLTQLGFPVHPINAYRNYVGDGARTLVERVLPRAVAHDNAAVEDCLEVYREIYGANWARKTKVYPGITGMLDGLVERGLTLAVLSNKPHRFAVDCVEHYLGAWPWAFILGMRDSHPKKPDPAGVREILSRVRCAPERTLFVGDTNIDMRTATAAGVQPVGVLWGFRQRDELVRHGAQTLLESPFDLLRMLH